MQELSRTNLLHLLKLRECRAASLAHRRALFGVELVGMLDFIAGVLSSLFPSHHIQQRLRVEHSFGRAIVAKKPVAGKHQAET